MIASVVTVGDELLNGQTIDTNSAWLGEKLNEIGVTLALKLLVGDTEDSIILQKGMRMILFVYVLHFYRPIQGLFNDRSYSNY